MAVNVEDRDWVEAVNFGSIQEVFKLHMEAQCNVLLAVAAPQHGIHCPMQLGVAPQLHLLKDTQDIFISESFFCAF